VGSRLLVKEAADWRWVHGFWARAGKKQLNALPPPPDSQEEGPSSPRPGIDSFYVPGCWVPREGEYHWRRGYWRTFQRNWVWIPSGYYWTPAGYIFVSGYWDYPLADRGLCFAPVYFTQPLWLDPDWWYEPDYGLRIPPLKDSLFVWPAWDWFCFGDWYAPLYAGWGIRPCHAKGRHFSDPLFSYYRWRHRNNPGWVSGLRNTFRDRRAGTLPLPPRTLATQKTLLSQSGLSRAQRRKFQLAVPLDQVRSAHFQLGTVTSTHRKRYRAAAEQFRRISRERALVKVDPRALSSRASGRAARTLATFDVPRSVNPSPAKKRRDFSGSGGPRQNGRSVYNPRIIRPLPSSTYRGPARTYGPSGPSYRRAPSYGPTPSYGPAASRNRWKR
jgi:hypothetical protein